MGNLHAVIGDGIFASSIYAQKLPVDWVNSFIGTTNFGATNPGAVVPNGMMSVAPFNVMGSKDNRFDKDARWWSTPYEYKNVYFIGYSHVNLRWSGLPGLRFIVDNADNRELDVDYQHYGSRYTDEKTTRDIIPTS